MMAHGDAYVFPGFLTPVLTLLFFPKPPTTFLTCFCRGERQKYAGKKVCLNRGSNSQPPGHESDTLSTEPPGRAYTETKFGNNIRHWFCFPIKLSLSLSLSLSLCVKKGTEDDNTIATIIIIMKYIFSTVPYCLTKQNAIIWLMLTSKYSFNHNCAAFLVSLAPNSFLTAVSDGKLNKSIITPYIAVENMVRKGEIACNKQFLLFSPCFLLYGTYFHL